MESLTDNVSQAEICRRHCICPVQLIKRREQFIQGGKTALAQRSSSDSRDEEIADLKKFIGTLMCPVRAKKRYRFFLFILLDHFYGISKRRLKRESRSVFMKRQG